MSVELLAAVAVFLAVCSLALAIFSATPSSQVERRLGGLRQVSVGRNEIDASGILRTSGSTFPFLRALLSGSAWADRASGDLLKAGLALKVSEYFLMRAVLAFLCAILVFLLSGGSGLGLLLGIGAAAIGFLIPGWYVGILKGRRIQKINSQLADALQLISNALRSGFAFTQAVELAAKQVQPPMQDELNQYLQDSALGARSEDALLALNERTGSYDVEMMVTTIIVQRTTGGNLSEILDNVAETIRERERLQGEIRALTASQRLTGVILSLYPPVLGLFMLGLVPDLMKVMFEESLGRVLLVIALVLQVLGAIAISRILRLDV